MEHTAPDLRAVLPSDEDILRDCRTLGIRPPGTREISLLREFSLLLESRSRLVNLIGPSEMPRLWPRHFLESLAFTAVLDRTAVVDIGSGAGFPGIILGIMGWDVVMLEPRRNRALFLEMAVGRLELSNARVVRARIEDYPSAAAQYTARAVSSSSVLLRTLAAKGAPDAVLTIREPDGRLRRGPVSRVFELPVPPLDRRGAVVQYRVGRAAGVPSGREREEEE